MENALTERTNGARHRAACRPSTPLTSFGQAVTGTTGRRAMAVVASSGLALTMGASTAAAVPQVSSTSGVASMANLVISPDVTTTSRTIEVSADVELSLDTAEVSSEAPPPPPPPPPPPAPAVVERPAADEFAASRSGERTEAAPEQQEEAAAEPQEEPVAQQATGDGAAVLSVARRYIGTPYVWGGGTPAGFDCSGFTAYVYAQFGVNLPRSSGAQRGAGRVVSAAEARPGDMVWWPGHIGIYSGGGNHIAARNPSKPLTEGPISHVGRGAPTYIRVIG